MAQLSHGRELLGTPAELLGAVRDPWAVGAAARAAGAQAPETRSVDDLPGPPGASRRVAAKAAARRRRARRTPVDGRPAAHHRDPSAPRPRAVVLRGGDRRWAARDGARASPSSCVAPPGFHWTGNVTPPRLPECRAGRARRPTAGGVRRGRCALRCARGIRSRRDLGRAPRLGARGQPAAAGRARAVRARQLRGPRAGCAWSRPACSRLAAGDEVCEGEARAVRPARPSGA